jgi:hypothetical protein
VATAFAVHELERESDQQRDKEQQVRQEGRRSCAAGIDVCIKAVRHEQQPSAEQTEEDDRGAGIEAPVEVRAHANRMRPRLWLQRSIRHFPVPLLVRQAPLLWPSNPTFM